MTATEELRETLALIGAYESEIRFRYLMLENDTRYEAELEREQLKLTRQQEKVDRLLSYRGEGAEDRIYDFQVRLAVAKKRVVELRNRAAIEKLIKLQETLNELQSVAASDIVSEEVDDAE